MRSDSRYTVSHGRNPAAAESETKMTAKTPIYMQDELDHANKVRERMVPQVEAARVLLASLKQALRYIEVHTAYQGAMTAEEVEKAILADANVSMTQIAANSVTTLARFNFHKARAAIAQAKAAGIKQEG